MAGREPELLKIPAGAGLPSLFNHGGGWYLFSADPEYRHRGRHIRRNLGLYGLYGSVVFLPVQDGQYSLMSAPNVSKPGYSVPFAISFHPFTLYSSYYARGMT